MIQRNFNYVTMFITGLFFILLGSFFILDFMKTWNWVYRIFVIGISIIALMKLINFIINFRKFNNKSSQFGDIAIWITAILISIFVPTMFYAILPRLIGCWLLLHAVVKVIVFFIRLKDHLSIQIHSVVFMIGDVVISLLLIISPSMYETFLSALLGMYFIIYGGNAMMDFFREILPNDSGNRFDQQIRLSVPPYISMLIPPHLLQTLLDKDNEDKIRDQFNGIKKNIIPDMEVLIHLAPSGPAMFGHTDLIYRGFVISYGCYDPHNRHLVGTLGDGVVIIAPRDTYIRNCLENENKVLVSFGISLNNEQKKRLNKRLVELFSTFIDFESDEQKKHTHKPYKGDCEDYISRVTRTSPNACFYKIKKGRLKTFFVVSSNCVRFMSSILSAIGLNLIDLSGIVSPGAYYDFLNRVFKSNKGFVISRKLYRKKDYALFEKEASVDTQLKEVINNEKVISKSYV